MYYLWIQDAQAGPFTLDQLRALWQDGRVNAGTPYRLEEQPDWALLETIQPLLGTPFSARVIAGFWARIGAYFVDAILLGSPVLILGIPLFSVFTQLGAWALLIGFGVALFYFGLLNSKFGEGQTVGKRLFGLEVVNARGEHISLDRSLARYSILAFPFYLNSLIQLLGLSATSWTVAFLGFLVIALGGAIIYLYLFNRRTRQSLHDLIVGTYVVKSAPTGEVKTLPVWRGHWMILGVTVLLLLALSEVAGALVHLPYFANLLSVQQALLDSPEIRSVSLFRGTTVMYSSSGGASRANNYSVQALLKQAPADVDAEEKKIAALVLPRDPLVMQDDNLVITLTYGYNFGLASWSCSQSVRHHPQEWKHLLETVPST
jgi:uncharacterized RDD family membrane protein YckC